ncbi:MAG: hypothetical protein ACLPZR_09485 [Solirubrobacteraceae bacterium]
MGWAACSGTLRRVRLLDRFRRDSGAGRLRAADVADDPGDSPQESAPGASGGWVLGGQRVPRFGPQRHEPTPEYIPEAAVPSEHVWEHERELYRLKDEGGDGEA